LSASPLPSFLLPGRQAARQSRKMAGRSPKSLFAQRRYPTMALRPKLRWMLIAVAVVVAGIQFVPVERTNPAVEAAFNGPPEVERILRRSCYDCHSHETRWPWYSRVAPVSWTVAQHVRQGREHLNFSRWNAREEAEVARECLEEVKAGRMPLRLYSSGIHPHGCLLRTCRFWRHGRPLLRAAGPARKRNRVRVKSTNGRRGRGSK